MGRGVGMTIDLKTLNKHVAKLQHALRVDIVDRERKAIHAYIEANLEHIADLVRFYISEQATTKTGERRGKHPGRHETGTMVKSFKYQGKAQPTDGRWYFDVGFDKSSPGYTWYQEKGTRTIEAMNSLVYTKELMNRMTADMRKTRGTQQDVFKYLQSGRSMFTFARGKKNRIQE